MTSFGTSTLDQTTTIAELPAIWRAQAEEFRTQECDTRRAREENAVVADAFEDCADELERRIDSKAGLTGETRGAEHVH